MSSPRAVSSTRRPFRLGLVVNPYAGVGGAAANKGSDDCDIKALADQGLLTFPVISRVKTFLHTLRSQVDTEQKISVITVPGTMGSDHFAFDDDCSVELIDYQPSVPTTSVDTVKSVGLICQKNVDLLVFVGGDGTARDVFRAAPPSQVCLGVPSGVKMHSAVYAVNPQMAANVVASMLMGQLLAVQLQEVRDIDEVVFRQGRVKSQYFGELLVPADERRLQCVKQGGLDIEELVLADIADHLARELSEEGLVVVGPGSTTLHILKDWGVAGTLLGVDLIENGRLIAADVNEQQIFQALHAQKGPISLVITPIGGQGHILGRGNQQLSPRVLKKIGRDNLRIVATETKLRTLKGRPLVMDSGDELLDEQWQGFIPVITGFDERVLYSVGYSQ